MTINELRTLSVGSRVRLKRKLSFSTGVNALLNMCSKDQQKTEVESGTTGTVTSADEKEFDVRFDDPNSTTTFFKYNYDAAKTIEPA